MSGVPRALRREVFVLSDVHLCSQYCFKSSSVEVICSFLLSQLFSDSVPLLSFVLYQCRLVLSCNVMGNHKHPVCRGEQTFALCEQCIRGTAVALTNGECGLSLTHFEGNRRNTSQVAAACGRKAHWKITRWLLPRLNLGLVESSVALFPFAKCFS